jgi:HK97 gp10 family phage protein
MPKTITWRVDGLRELGQQFKKLDAGMQKKAAPRATAAGAQVIKKRARRKIQTNPSIDTGSLLNAVIVKKVPKSEAQLTSEHIVTVRGRGKKPKKEGKRPQAIAPHAHLVEFGTVHMPAEPFLRPAIEEGKGEAVDAMTEKLRSFVEQEAGKT